MIYSGQVLLVCHVSEQVGVGHLSRMLALAQAINGLYCPITVKLLLFGKSIEREELRQFDSEFIPAADFINEIEKKVRRLSPLAVVFDLYQAQTPPDIYQLLQWLQQLRIITVSVDSLENCDEFDLVWIPSFFLSTLLAECARKIHYGWDCYLLQRRLLPKVWKPGKRLLVLSGGSDVMGLGKWLPDLLDRQLDPTTIVTWVKGPFAAVPQIPPDNRCCWSVADAPQYLDSFYLDHDYILTLYGVSLFEALQYGCPCVVFAAPDQVSITELEQLAASEVALVAEGAEEAVNAVVQLMIDEQQAQRLVNRGLQRMSGSGAQGLADQIAMLWENRGSVATPTF